MIYFIYSIRVKNSYRFINQEDFDDHFPGNVGIGAFDDDIPMKEPEVDVIENDPSDDLGQALHNVQADYKSETERLKRYGSWITVPISRCLYFIANGLSYLEEG